eukprot:2739248-Prymnesium_polylepis.2
MLVSGGSNIDRWRLWVRCDAKMNLIEYLKRPHSENDKPDRFVIPHHSTDILLQSALTCDVDRLLFCLKNSTNWCMLEWFGEKASFLNTKARLAELENCHHFLYTVDIGFNVLLARHARQIILVRRDQGSTASIPLFYDFEGQPQRVFRKFGWHSRLGAQKVVRCPITEVTEERRSLYDVEIDGEDAVMSPIKFLIYSPLKHIWIAHTKASRRYPFCRYQTPSLPHQVPSLPLRRCYRCLRCPC